MHLKIWLRANGFVCIHCALAISIFTYTKTIGKIYCRVGREENFCISKGGYNLMVLKIKWYRWSKQIDVGWRKWSIFWHDKRPLRWSWIIAPSHHLPYLHHQHVSKKHGRPKGWSTNSLLQCLIEMNPSNPTETCFEGPWGVSWNVLN